MRKVFLFFGMAIISTSVFAADNAKTNCETESKNTLVEMQCATRSSTVTNTETGESITVSCTKCAEEGYIAVAEALVCAQTAIRKVESLIAG